MADGVGRRSDTAPATADLDAECAPSSLLDLPPDVVTLVLVRLGVESLSCVARASRFFWCGDPPPLESALRVKARAFGARIPETLPANETSWPSLLSWALRRQQFHRATTVSCGFLHVAIIDNACRLFMLGAETVEYGDEDYVEGEYDLEVLEKETRPGLLGFRTEAPDVGVLERPRRLLVLPRKPVVYAVSAGERHTLLLTDYGIYSFGDARAREALGRGALADELSAGTPRKLAFVSAADGGLWSAHITAVSAGAQHSLFLRHDGRVYACGHAGACGHADGGPRDRPCLIEGLSSARAVALSAGSGFSLVLDASGVVWAFGRSAHNGALGLGGGAPSAVPPGATWPSAMPSAIAVSTIGQATIGRRCDSLGVGGGCRLPRPLRLSERIREVAAGRAHSLVLTDAGRVLSFGSGKSGQLGHGHGLVDTSTPTLIEALRHVSDPRCGYSSLRPSALPTPLLCLRPSASATLPPPLSLLPSPSALTSTRHASCRARAAQVRIGAISAGAHHSLAVDEAHVVYAWGEATQLGVTPTRRHERHESALPSAVKALQGHRVVAVAAGHSQSLALSAARGAEGEGGCRLFGWGSEVVPGVQGSWTPEAHVWAHPTHEPTTQADVPIHDVCGPGYAPMPPPPWWAGWRQP